MTNLQNILSKIKKLKKNLLKSFDELQTTEIDFLRNIFEIHSTTEQQQSFEIFVKILKLESQTQLKKIKQFYFNPIVS